MKHPSPRMGRAAAALLLSLTLPLAACQTSDVVGIEVGEVTGTYTMTVLRFDPQGVLPESNVLPALGEAPQLNLTAAGQAQISYRDPATTLLVTVPGTFVTTPTGVRISFANASPYPQLLLSQRTELTFTAASGTLGFDGPAPDGVNRARLVQLVPTLAGEQLLDPTPGTLRVAFTRN